MQTCWLSVFALLCLPLVAQDAVPAAAGAKAPALRFTLAAGRHDVAGLLAMVGQARGRPITYDAAALERASDRYVELQRELQLGREEWEDVATMLLHTRGLWLTRQAGGALAVVPAAEVEQFALGEPRERTAAELLARPYRTEIVRTQYVSRGAAEVLAGVLRPLLIGTQGRPGVVMRVEEGTILLEGLTCGVAHALRLILVADGAEVGPGPEPAWPDAERCAWPGGELDVTAFLNAASEELEANVLCPAEVAGVRLDLGPAAELTPRAWHAEASRVLRRHGLALTVVHAEQRLFELLPITGSPAAAEVVLWRSTLMRPDAVVDPQLPVQPVLTLVPMAPDAIRAAAGRARAAMRGEACLLLGSCPAGLLVAGLSDPVADVVRAAAGKAEEGGRR
jgi:hypothetical protein